MLPGVVLQTVCHAHGTIIDSLCYPKNRNEYKMFVNGFSVQVPFRSFLSNLLEIWTDIFRSVSTSALCCEPVSVVVNNVESASGSEYVMILHLIA